VNPKYEASVSRCKQGYYQLMHTGLHQLINDRL